MIMLDNRRDVEEGGDGLLEMNDERAVREKKERT